MSLTLYYHPLSSFCHKVLIALYENGTPFKPQLVQLNVEAEAAAFKKLWPIGKFPVLRDEASERTVPESSIIIEYLERHHPGPTRLLPDDEVANLDARFWDRFFDLYIHMPMQEIVADRLHGGDGTRVAGAKALIRTSYDTFERHIADKQWVIGDRFTIADCAAAPALFYGGVVVPFAASHPSIAAYFERLLQRPSYARALAEARPYMHMFPFKDQLPARFLDAASSAA